MLLGATVEGIGIPLSELLFCWRMVSFHRDIILEGIRADFRYLVSDHTFPHIPNTFLARECVILEVVLSEWFGGSVVEFPCD